MPAMVDRKSGVVINVSSASAIIPAPMLTIYAATKVRHQVFSFIIATFATFVICLFTCYLFF